MYFADVFGWDFEYTSELDKGEACERATGVGGQGFLRVVVRQLSSDVSDEPLCFSSNRLRASAGGELDPGY